MRDVLHYLGYDQDHGGIVSVIRAQAAVGETRALLGLNRGARQLRQPELATMEFTPLPGEQLNPTSFWRARRVAREVQAWLAGGADRVFHGHSRAGLVVGSWLHQWGERRVVVSVHCYGRRRWFYRQAAERLGRRLYWLSPAMKRYYEIASPDNWDQCMPGGVPIGAAIASTRPDAETRGFRLVGVGERVPRKRWDLVLAALGEMPDDFVFEHIGGGTEPEITALAEQTAALGLSPRVQWHGREADSRRILAQADALVVASENEPFAMAILEALAVGVPVIAADSGGTVDAVVSGANGELFRSGDALDLAAVVQRWRVHRSDKGIEQPNASWRFAATHVAQGWADIYATLAE